MKKTFAVFLLGIFLFCLTACNTGTNVGETAVFNTENVNRITFYGYYGSGSGSVVPAQYLDEIKTWLNSFAVDKEAPAPLAPGTNTVFVELEYDDGTVVKQGLDTVSVRGVTYYTKSDPAPACYEELLSKVSLN